MRVDNESPRWRIRLMSELDAADARAIVLAKTLTPQQLNWKASPGQWSIGQCLEHLCVANDVYGAAIASALPSRRRKVVEEITPGWLGRWFIRTYIEPSFQSAHGRAPKRITPRTQVDPAILDRFLISNQGARALVDRARDCDVNHVRFKNPFVPLIRFTVGTGLEILTRHQRRHLLQAERVRECPGFP